MTVPLELALLPKPQVIEELSFEAVLAQMQADLVVRYPDIAPILELESSVANTILEGAAYRETLLRARINDAARANLVAYATGSDLDHAGADASPPVSRMTGEDDDRFRTRILLTTMARNVGSEQRYRLVALNTDLSVKDAIAYRVGRSPTVNVALLSTASDGVASAGLITAVAATFALPENHLVNGDVNVLSAVTSVVNVAAALTLIPNVPSSVLAGIEASLRAAWLAEGGLGRDLTVDWVKARLMATPSVYKAVVSLPVADVIVPPFQAASIGTVTLTIAGVNQ